MGSEIPLVRLPNTRPGNCRGLLIASDEPDLAAARTTPSRPANGSLSESRQVVVVRCTLSESEVCQCRADDTGTDDFYQA